MQQIHWKCSLKAENSRPTTVSNILDYPSAGRRARILMADVKVISTIFVGVRLTITSRVASANGNGKSSWNQYHVDNLLIAANLRHLNAPNGQTQFTRDISGVGNFADGSTSVIPSVFWLNEGYSKGTSTILCKFFVYQAKLTFGKESVDFVSRMLRLWIDGQTIQRLTRQALRLPPLVRMIWWERTLDGHAWWAMQQRNPYCASALILSIHWYVIHAIHYTYYTNRHSSTSCDKRTYRDNRSTGTIVIRTKLMGWPITDGNKSKFIWKHPLYSQVK